MKITIERATIDSAADLAQVGVTTFTETWAANYTKEILSAYLHEKYDQSVITCELQNPDIIYHAAYDESKMIGFSKLSRKQDLGTWIKGNNLEVCRIYVLQAYHDKKVGKLLMEKSIEFAKEEGMDSVVLGVWEGNHRAIAFYKKWGFEMIGTHPFYMADLVETDWVMQKLLR